MEEVKKTLAEILEGLKIIGMDIPHLENIVKEREDSELEVVKPLKASYTPEVIREAYERYGSFALRSRSFDFSLEVEEGYLVLKFDFPPTQEAINSLNSLRGMLPDYEVKPQHKQVMIPDVSVMGEVFYLPSFLFWVEIHKSLKEEQQKS
ncbi:hypothetical protein DRN62_02675 [Nanoarchaeota archaeon]|nr:MAG: hypothetical protein DRN62_02675 [Nanoarchaeota archaeon]